MTVRGVKFKFDPSESVLCFEPDVTKARVLYNAKILDFHVGRSNDGVRQPEYLVHFLGWNSSWDRIVPEHSILSNSEEHRELMKLLAQTARKIKRNSVRKRKIEILLRKYFSEDPEMAANFRTTISSTASESDAMGNGSASDGEVSDEDGSSSDLESTGDNEATLVENEEMRKINHEEGLLELADGEPCEVHLELPENLKRRLEDDCYYVSCLDKRVELPANPNVISLLEGYVKNFTANLIYSTTEKRPPRRERSRNPPQEKNVELVKQAVDGLRVLFDFTLPAVLLYSSERDQYNTAMERYSPATSTTDTTEQTDKTRDRSQEPDISSPRLRSRPGLTCSSPTSKNGCTSPRGSRLSPRASANCGIKKELPEDVATEESPPPSSRRVKRNTLSESGRKRVSSETKTETDSPKNIRFDDINIQEIEPASRRISLRSGATGQTQFAELDRVTRTKRKSSESKAGTLSNRVTVPPPLVLAESSKDSMSSQDTPNRPSSESSVPSMIYCNGSLRIYCHDLASTTHSPSTNVVQVQVSSQLYKTKEAAMEHICTWRLVPQSVLSQQPAMPSHVYGAHHLLRLFVQLPGILSQMPIPRKQREALMSHLEMFVDYLSERSEELFPESVYK